MNKIILTCVTGLMLTLSTVSYAGCEQRPIFNHSEENADIYEYKGHVITVLKGVTFEQTYQSFLSKPEFAITREDDFFIAFDKTTTYLNLIYRTKAGKAAVVYHPNIFNELYRFNTCF